MPPGFAAEFFKGDLSVVWISAGAGDCPHSSENSSEEDAVAQAV